MIDLHIHTRMSDGTLSPEEVVSQASQRGLRAIAVTDHDTVSGVIPAQAEAKRLGIEVISGVEISAQWPSGILHILGYFLRPDDVGLADSLDYLRKMRQERVPKIVSKLRSLNVFITVEEVARAAMGGVPGRPHIAAIMVEKGHVRRIQDAFDRYLRKGAPAYVVKVKLSTEVAIRLIRQAGGVPVLAHPHSLGENDADRLDGIIKSLVDQGLEGIEAYYPQHAPRQTRMFLDAATRYGLVATGGTDFHGANKPHVHMGVFPGRGPLPYSLVEDLRERKRILFGPNGDGLEPAARQQTGE
jgi:3',5'-nucleoside bisphosphate phosphatase